MKQEKRKEMNYRLIKCTLAGQIDRIRGEESITVPVTCTFMTDSKEVIEVPGIASCASVKELSKAIDSAIEDAKNNLSTFFGATTATSSKMSTEKFSALMKSSVVPGVTNELRKVTNRDEYSRMTEPAGEDKQRKVGGLCEALGIDTIDVTDWSNVEVLVLINYLERLTDPLVKEA
jgi:hypothetical protein